MKCLLFNFVKTKIYSIKNQKKSRFGHTFGGMPLHKGVTHRGQDLFLMFNFNLADARLGLTLPNLKWLPLYYALGSSEGALSYQILSESRIKILSKPYDSFMDDQAFAKLPPFLPKVGVDFLPYPYNPAKFENALEFAGVFGLDQLSPRDRAKAVKMLRKEYEKFYCRPASDETPEQHLYDRTSPFIQGTPCSRCPNAKCENYHYKEGVRIARLTFLLHVTPDEGDVFYDIIAGDDFGELSFEVCPLCNSVQSFNACT